ncbi:competence/damage-inducible protein A [Chitinophagaceae bacterium LB-8]|uniref:CinA-like protein n=1 Tax=Paraflavisolibacter caeni TaxID=2982496 RepID=A0A9X2XY13_9BACT|nr:competence/damage-inducible protein A [Paraflavisolibacter caeni]MCU7550797.1 competence/damage-inducible protein A [Paraflavisolibacter caeni]
MVQASIITIGDELLIGQTIDTNSAFIAQELNKLGIWVKRRIAIGDKREDILDALETESKECNIVIITGGLGPTADDITKPTLCEFFDAKIVVDEGALENVKNIFIRINRPLIERNLKQAEVPDKCTVLPNLRGTAPGMWFEKEGVVYASLPGVPHEMEGLMLNSVLPKLKEHFQMPAIVHKTLFTAGKGESEIAELLIEFENKLPEYIKLAYLPSFGMVKLRLTGKSNDQIQLEQEVSVFVNELKSIVSEWLVADEDISLQEALHQLLKQMNKTIATAESCTGGYIAHLITSVPGSSSVFNGGVVSYANEAKEAILGVQKATLEQFGAVSEQTVIEMSKGVLQKIKTTYGLATSGIMGPDGGTPEKPVGTVWIAVTNGVQTKTQKFQFRFDRKRNIQLAANAALNMMRLFILTGN